MRTKIFFMLLVLITVMLSGCDSSKHTDWKNKSNKVNDNIQNPQDWSIWINPMERLSNYWNSLWNSSTPTPTPTVTPTNTSTPTPTPK